MISEKEVQRIIALSAGETLDYDRGQTWVDLFREQAGLHPDRTAVTAENGSLSYAELDRLSDRLAAALVEKAHVQPDEFIAVRMGRVKEFHLAVLAIHKAGAAYMPIDLEYPQARVDYMMADSGALLTLTEDSVAGMLAEGTESAPFASRCAPDRRAYMIYTSGSTGMPKGVVIPQRALTNFVHFIVNRWGLTKDSRIALHSNFAFDAAVEDLFPALTAGGTVFVVPERARRDIFEMREYIAAHGINGGSYSTQFGQLLGADAELDLDYICLGGEAMTSVPRARGPVYNAYGPTEFTVDATYYEVEKGREYRNIPIGRPLHNCSAYIVDDKLNLLKPGETGELCLAGPQLAEGYWNRPELTAERFTQLALPGHGTTRVYRTGDLARWNEEGQLEFCGRIDFQVKLRGFRVELGEVENCAARYPGIRQAAAEVRKNTLCLYYTAADAIDEAKLSAHMAESLADYMVPGAFMRLEAMPYNVNGKIDRKALPDPVIQKGSDYAAPETETEKAAVIAMSRALGMAEEDLSVTADFFEMGGDSIKAIRLVSLLREAGRTASVADVMRARTARKLAESLQKPGIGSISQEPFEGPVEDTAIFAFFKDLNYPQPDYYNQSTLLKWRGRASLEALQRASDAITAQHDMLRAVLRDGHLFVRPAGATIPVEEYSLEADTTEAVKALCEDIQSHLNTGEALVRQALIHAGARDLFFLTAHHTIVDGVSWRIWLDDLETAYGKALRGEPVTLPAKTHTYKDYAEAMKAWRSSYGLSLELPYWKGVEAKLLSLDTSANKDYTRRFETLNAALSAAETEALLRVKLNKFRLEINDLLLTAVGEGYRMVFGGDAVSISLEGHGREYLGKELSVDRAIGWFTSEYPVVLEGIAGDAEGDLLRVKETLRAIPNKGAGYNILAFVKGAPETAFQTDRAPLMIFNYLGDVSGERTNGEYFEPDSADGFSAGLDYAAPQNHDGGDLVMNCLIEEGQFSLWLDYNSGRFSRAQAEAFAEAVLNRITALGTFLGERSEPLPPTASDLGETEWTPAEFSAVVKAFAARGETLRRIYPLTPMQEGMLLEHVAHPESFAYRLIDINACERPLEEAALRRAIDRLAEKHEALRTAIIHKGVSHYRQAITDRRLPLTVVEARAGEDAFEAAKRIRQDMLRNGYDLQDRPLTQFVYVKGEERNYLIFATHHIVTDGWCFDTLYRDLNALLRGEEASGLDEGRYEQAVRELLQRDRLAAAGCFRKVFEGYENNAVVPSFGEIPMAERGDDQFCGSVPADLAERLNALCRDAGATQAEGFYLAWGLALRTLNRMDDVAFTVISSGRDGFSTDVSELTGLFINPVPIRVRVGRDMDARGLLGALHSQIVETKPWDFCPLSDIQNALGSDVRLGGLVISFENYASDTQQAGPLKPALVREEHESGDVSVDAQVRADGSLSVLLSYDPALYRGTEIARVFALFLNYLQRMVDMPDTPAAKYPALNSADREAVLKRSWGERFDYDKARTWIDLFREQVRLNPGQTAVVAENGSLTYRELDALSDRVAAGLVKMDVGPGAFVAVRMGRVKEFLVAATAIQKAGAAYMPIDLEYPAERIAYMMKDSGAKLTLTEDETQRILRENPDCGGFKPRCAPDCRAYMIYTSGSTGVPKGVVIPQRALTNFVHFIVNRWGLTKDSRVALHSNFAFDASVEDLYPPLTAGGTVFIVPENARRDIFEMKEFIAAHGVNGGSYSTQFGQLLGADAELDLDYVCLGGEAMTSVPHARGPVYNSYGPTEFTVDATYYELEKGREYRNIPIGRPLYNCAALILDDNLEPLPFGVTGELCLAGPQLAEGYWNRPELTAEKFTELRLPGGEPLKIYRTGDLARWNHEGQLEYCGRIDFQVKLRGFRIELGEIESAALSCAGVGAAVAEVKRNGTVQTLCLYYTEKDGVKAAPEALKRICEQKLAEFMVPDVFMRLDEMPMTLNGKVNRKALPMPVFDVSGEKASPETETEKALYAIAAKVLGTDSFGATDPLTRFGLTSIAAMRLLSAVDAGMHRRLTVADILREPTICAMAALIDRQAPEAQAYALREEYPLSMTQLGIYADSVHLAGTTAYNIPSLYKLGGSVDMGRLRDALERAFQAHPFLFMTLRQGDDGDVRAVRHAPGQFDIPVGDALPPINELVRPFDLGAGEPLFRVGLYDTKDGKYLFMDTHHIISDGASLDILMEDIAAAYDGGTVEPEAYTGFEAALDEEKLRATDRYDRAKAWYKGLLSGVEREMLPEGDAEGGAPAQAHFIHPTAPDHGAIGDFCKACGTTENAFFNAAFAFALSAFAGRREAFYATIYNGRNDTRLSRAVTMLVKTFPVLISTAKDTRVRDFIAAMAEQLMTSMANDLCSFAELAQDYGIASDVLFAYQGEGGDSYWIGGEEAEAVELSLKEDKAPILFQVFAQGDHYLFDCDYRSDLYTEGFMRALADCVERAAEAFLKAETLGDVCLVGPEAERALERVNQTEVPYPVTDIVSMYRAAVEKYPDNTALVYGDERYTYRQEDDISERIAGYLRAKGIGREAVVSVLIHRSAYMRIASLGVLKAGAAYQPLDPGYPDERLAFMMKDADSKLLIADEDLLAKAPEYKGPVLLTKDIASLPACEKLTGHPAPEDLFILLYTSGSTGVPKGVMLEHGNIANFCQWYRDYYGLEEHSRVAAYASYGFDACMMDLYPALTVGACACIAEEEIRLDLAALEAWFNRAGITHAFMTTQVGRQFYTMAHAEKLRWLSAGGEKLVPVEPREGGTRLVNAYGPTECTIFSTTMPVDRLYKRVPIGKPLSNYRLYVVDENLHMLPPLIPGELLIAGRGVGRGYLNRPDLTEKAFIKNPFSDEPEYARAYRTGDVVRLLPDGNVDFIGRNDGQVKVRGFRIELTEVEAVIRDYPGIADTTVQAFEDAATGEKAIAAYVVSDSAVDVRALNDFIRARKPAYMVPAVTMQIDAIPLNQNQKVNRKALPKPKMKPRTSAGGNAAAPLNMLEKEIKGMVAEIVKTDDFGITDRFSELGLSSITAIRLAMQIYKRFGVQIDARGLVAEGCVQGVENAILETLLAPRAEAPETPAPEAAEQKPPSCRLSFAQQGVYAEYQAHPEAVTYNMPFALKFPDGITAEQLKAAILQVVGAHPYILCRFAADENNEVIQEPIPDDALTVPIVEMTPEAYEARKAAFVRPFDLEKGPAVRFEIIRADALYLLADMHHLVSDGASMDIFFTQLCAALDGEAPQKEQFDYYDYVAGEEITREAEDFFEARLAGLEEATQLIPDVFEENLPHTERSAAVPTDFAAVKAFAAQNGVTPAAVYLAAALLAYGRYVCEDTVAIATISNGRSNLKLADTIGMFVNTLPLAMAVDHREKTADYLRRVAGEFYDTIAHEHYPFARIAAKYGFHPMASYTYQIGVMDDYHTRCGDVTADSLVGGEAKLPVGVYIAGSEESAVIQVLYDAALFSDAMMRGLAESVENAVRGLMTCDTLAEISLTGEEQWKILDGYNKPWDLDYDIGDTAVRVFRRNARSQPDKTAAVYQDRRYTYRELDELTDRLAARIYRRVCAATGKTCLAEEVAAILLPRDENVFILPLAAVKAGLAYEPLDPSYPRERLNYMVKDAGACVLIAEESLLDHVDEYEGAVLTVRELYAMPDAPAVPAEPKPEDRFIMLYTSGSTGAPKGCQIEHRNLVAYAHGLRNIFCTREDTIAAYASFGFDVNMSDVFCTLLNGGTVCLVPEEIRMNLDRLAAWFDEMGITALVLTTQVGVQFLQNYPNLKTLRLLVMGGEKLPAVDPSRIGYTIANGYGPTENCCGVSIFPIRAWEPNIPIGRPFDTIHAYVLDKTGHRLPAGAAGEYCLSGPQVTRGYLNRPDKTAEAYEPCPFNGFRMYHTGDIVRYRQNGDVEFVGRRDGQVKIRGFRVETKEVEAVIRGFEGIRDVTVQPYDYEGGGKYLAAFVVSDGPVDRAELTAFIKARKPAYMAPAAIMQIDAIPLTVNMKVDKKALPKPSLQKAEYVAPQGKAEADFCAVFAEALGAERVGAEDDFFELGGSSILAMKVVIAAGKAGYSIVYNDVFKYTTPRAMAQFAGGGSVPEPAAQAAAPEAAGTAPEIGPDGYDYGKIHALLRRNTPEAFLRGERLPLNDVLLLGGTGYLGCHVLHELILHHEGRLWCFVRPGKEESGEQRLRGMLKYYFGDDYASLFGKRITIIEGDATDPAALKAFRAPAEGMTAINCAASVKHFARGDEIERANVASVKNLAAWCEANGARLVHISTGSVIGSRAGGMPPERYRFDEHRLYAGQDISGNQYVHSKFMAERHIYEEMLARGLRAKVLRMGNLAPRAEDGQFQINDRTNSYMNMFRAYQTLGMVPYDALDAQVEFSPIDQTARAVLALAETPDDCVCFFPLNPHRPLMADVVRALNEAGHPIRGAESEAFEQALQAALSDEKKREAVGSLIAYDSGDGSEELGLESCDISHTVRILARLGFAWPETGSAYIRRFIEKLDQKGYFRGND